MDEFDEDHWENLQRKGYNETDLCLSDEMTWPFYVRQAMQEHIDLADEEEFGEDTTLLQDVVGALKTREPYRLPIDKKLTVLQFLVDKCFDTSSGHDELQYRQRNTEKKVRQRERARERGRESDDASEEENSEECDVCGKGGQLICCDTCPYAYHLKCIHEHKSVLEMAGDWSCPECCFPDCNRSLSRTRPLRWKVGRNFQHFREPVAGCVYRADAATSTHVPLSFGEIETALKATEGSPKDYDSDGEEQKALRTVLSRALSNRASAGVSEEPQLFFKDFHKMGQAPSAQAFETLKATSLRTERYHGNGMYLNVYRNAIQDREEPDFLLKPLPVIFWVGRQPTGTIACFDKAEAAASGAGNAPPVSDTHVDLHESY